MPFEVLERKIKTIPAEYLEEFTLYVDSFLFKIQNENQSQDSAINSLNALLSMPKKIPAGLDYKAEYADYLEQKYGRLN